MGLNHPFLGTPILESELRTGCRWTNQACITFWREFQEHTYGLILWLCSGIMDREHQICTDFDSGSNYMEERQSSDCCFNCSADTKGEIAAEFEWCGASGGAHRTHHRSDCEDVCNRTKTIRNKVQNLHGRDHGPADQNWLVVWNIFYFPIYWVSNHPNRRTHIFRRGGPTTNQSQNPFIRQLFCHHLCGHHWGRVVFRM